MSSKEGTHTPGSASSLDIEPGMLVRHRRPTCPLTWRERGLGLIIDIHTNPYTPSDIVHARILWSGAEYSSLCPLRDLVPCNE